MGSFSIWHWLIVLAVVLVLFGGGGKISKLMGDFGKGLKSFKKNIKEEGDAEAEDEDRPKQAIDSEAAKPTVNASTASGTASSPTDNKDRAANG